MFSGNETKQRLFFMIKLIFKIEMFNGEQNLHPTTEIEREYAY
jgi:hypothetical protein